jgi:hypothetical protein
MREHDARKVRAVQAFDATCPADHPLWTAEDRAWASRVARDEVGSDAPAHDFIVARARAAMQRLAPRDARLAQWVDAPAARGTPVALIVGLALAAGVLAPALGALESIDLLAPPVWAVVAWNGLVYLVLALRLFGGRLFTPPSALARWLARWTGTPAPVAPRRSGSAEAYKMLAAQWARDAAPMAGSRLARALHLGAAALGAGLVAGLYLRGVVFDFRAGWQSTFLDAPQVHTLLSTLLGPASVLSGIALPDRDGVAALRLAAGEAARAPAAAWIHLYALTVTLTVVLPRLLLALASGLRAGHLSRRLAVEFDAAYLQAMRREQGSHRPQHVVVLPHVQAPSAQATLALRAALVPTLGEALHIELLAPVPFGQEDEAPLDGAVRGKSLAVLWFDLTATPEAEQQGRLMARVAQAARAGAAEARMWPMLLLEETAFGRRFAGDRERRGQRREAWRTLAQAHGLRPLFVELESGEAAAREQAVARWFEAEAAPAAAIA